MVTFIKLAYWTWRNHPIGAIFWFVTEVEIGYAMRTESTELLRYNSTVNMYP